MNSSSFSTVNPATGEQIETFPFFCPQETEAALVRAEKSFRSYRKLSVDQRAQLLSKLAAMLRMNKARLSKIITMEMGKILPEAEAEVEKCAWEADWYAEHGPQMLADTPAPTGKVEAYVSYQPLGPILAIMPWNFPLWQATRMAIPTLLAGNVVLLKDSPNTQRSSLDLERVMLESGFPEGVIQNLVLKTEDIVNVINDSRVHRVRRSREACAPALRSHPRPEK
jgi:acyl-CoA reductase-like NAD-dependent aldehyde dehydrogenase